MRLNRTITMALAAVAVSGLLVAGALAATSNGSADHDMSGMTMTKAAPMTAADLRVALDNLFGEHAVLAMNATNAGVTGSKSFPAAAKALDKNSVALSKAIASVYGAKAGQTFLNGKFMWRDHIKFFVDYTVATAKKDKAGQTKAVNNLKQYTVVFGNFLAGATGPAEARRPQRPARSRPRAQGSARRLRGRQLRVGGGAVPLRVQPHVHDRRPRRRRDRQAEEPQVALLLVLRSNDPAARLAAGRRRFRRTRPERGVAVWRASLSRGRGTRRGGRRVGAASDRSG